MHNTIDQIQQSNVIFILLGAFIVFIKKVWKYNFCDKFNIKWNIIPFIDKTIFSSFLFISHGG